MRKFFCPLYITYYIYHIGNAALKADTMFQIARSFTVTEYINELLAVMQSFRGPTHLHDFSIGCVGFKTVHLRVSIGSSLITEKKCCFGFRKEIFRNDLGVCFSVKFFPCLPAWRVNKTLITLPY